MRWDTVVKPIFKLLYAYKKRYSTGIFLLIAVDLLQVALPDLTGRAVDALRTANSKLGWLLAQIAALTVLIAFLRFLYREYLLGTTRSVEHDLRREIFEHALGLPLVYYDRKGPAPVMALSTSDVVAVRIAIGLGMMLLVDALVMIAASVSAINRLVGVPGMLWCLLPLPPALIIAVYIGRLTRRRARAAQDQNSRLIEVAQEAFAGAKVIQAYSVEDRFSGRFTEVSADCVQANLALARLQSFYAPLTHTAPLLCYALVIYIGGARVVNGDLTIGGLTAFMGYLGLIIWPVMGLGYLVNILQRGLASCERLHDFFNLPEVEADRHAQSFLPRQYASPEILIQGLEFSYSGSDRKALRNISMHIPAGSVIGVVGPTGSGKSTLLRLLLRLYDIPANRVFLDGLDICEWPVEVLRHTIGYVPQDVILFGRSIGENISFGQSFSREDIVAAAQAAGIEADIDARPNDYQAAAGELGQALSGGQRQRIAIARAIIKRPRLLLLDDVYSALDFETQRQVAARLAPFLRKSTAVIVSQRISAVAHTDKIYVLDQGEVVEQGTHEELLAAQGLYFRLSEQQLQGETA